MLTLIKTSDGSHSLYNESLDETYHSIHGAIQESKHVFIEHGLHYAKKCCASNTISVLEVGFGTGLNALLTMSDRLGGTIDIIYDAIEPAPLLTDVTDKLNYPSLLRDPGLKDDFTKMHGATWNEYHKLSPHFTIRKIQNELQGTMLERNRYDLVYFDAFAPSKQPDMWDVNILSRVVEAMNHRGIFVTYSAKGQLKRDLATLGLVVQIHKGPPGKAQMIRAIKGK